MATAAAEPVNVEEQGRTRTQRNIIIVSCLVVAIIVGVVVAITSTRGSKGSPSIVNPPEEDYCFKTTKELANVVRDRDDSVFEEFLLCPNTILEVNDVLDLDQVHDNDFDSKAIIITSPTEPPHHQADNALDLVVLSETTTMQTTTNITEDDNKSQMTRYEELVARIVQQRANNPLFVLARGVEAFSDESSSLSK